MITRNDPDISADPVLGDSHHYHVEPGLRDDASDLDTPAGVSHNNRPAAEGHPDATRPTDSDRGEITPGGPANETNSLPADSAELIRTRPSADSAAERRDEVLPLELLIAGYQRLTVPEIIRHAERMSVEQLREVKEYEKSHRRRKTLLTKLERLLRNPGPAKAATPAGEVRHPHRA